MCRTGGNAGKFFFKTWKTTTVENITNFCSSSELPSAPDMIRSQEPRVQYPLGAWLPTILDAWVLLRLDPGEQVTLLLPL